jgi:hypothetical protein
MNMDIVIDSDEWVIWRLAELRQKGERAELRIVFENGKIVDCYIRRSNGLEERKDSR